MYWYWTDSFRCSDQKCWPQIDECLVGVVCVTLPQLALSWIWILIWILCWVLAIIILFTGMPATTSCLTVYWENLMLFNSVLSSLPKTRIFWPHWMHCHLQGSNLICLLKSLKMVWLFSIRNLWPGCSNIVIVVTDILVLSMPWAVELVVCRYNEVWYAIIDLASLVWNNVIHEPVVCERSATSDGTLVADLCVQGV